MLAATALLVICLVPLSQQTAPTSRTARTAPPVVRLQPVPDDAVRLHTRITSKLAPSARAKINSLAASLNERLRREPKAWPPGILDELYRSAHNSFPDAPSSSIDMIVFEIMMQANQGQESDLQAAMNEAKATAATKGELRDQSQTDHGTVATPSPIAPAGRTSAPVRDGSLDSMNEMSEMTSMRLQMAMDRRSKFVETISNVMKTIASTQEAIVQNLK